MWKKIIDFLSHPIIQLLGVPGIIAVITWLVTRLEKLTVWQIWLVILFGVGCGLWIMNQVTFWRERHKKRISQYTDKELEKVIREWVDIPTLAFIRQEPEQDLYFKFALKDEYDRFITIIRKRNEPSMILLLSEMTFDDDKQKLTQANWQTLADGLRLELARLGIQFIFNGDPNKLQRIRVTDAVIIDDTLTGFYLRQRIMFVIRALVLIREVGKKTYKEMGFADYSAEQ
jgi:hypothetical protein